VLAALARFVEVGGANIANRLARSTAIHDARGLHQAA